MTIEQLTLRATVNVDQIEKLRTSIFTEMDSIESDMRKNFYSESSEIYNRALMLQAKEFRSRLDSKINDCKSLLGKILLEFEVVIPSLNEQSLIKLAQKGIPLSNNELADKLVPINKKVGKSLLGFLVEESNVKQNSKISYLKGKLQELTLKTSYQEKLIKQLQSNPQPKIAANDKGTDENQSDMQIGAIIQRKIHTLKCSNK